MNVLAEPISKTELTALQAKAREALDSVCDPEIPVLTIEDLGVLRDISVDDQRRVKVTITPTYSGCPAMSTISIDIQTALAAVGFNEVSVDLVLSPAWTTDWMTESGLAKLKAYGIAPPSAARARPPTDISGHRHSLSVPLFVQQKVACPRCDSTNTHRVSAFGSTACKEHWLCKDCKEPFDHFKCH